MLTIKVSSVLLRPPPASQAHKRGASLGSLAGPPKQTSFAVVLGSPTNQAAPPTKAPPTTPRAVGSDVRDPPTAEKRSRSDRARELEPELLPFRLGPSVLIPPPAAPLGSPLAAGLARAEVSRLAEQLVTRLRLGRSREGAVVDLRLAVAGASLDVRLLEVGDVLEVHADGADDSLRRAIAAELARRGLSAVVV